MSAIDENAKPPLPVDGRIMLPVIGNARLSGFSTDRLLSLNADNQVGRYRLAFAGLFCLILLLYARPNELFPETFGEAPIIKSVAIATMAIYFISKMSRGDQLTIWPLELKAVLLIALLGAAFIPIAASPQDSIDALWEMFLKVVVIFVLLINLVDNSERLRMVTKAVVFCGGALAVLALRSYLSGDFKLMATKDGQIVALRIMGAGGGFFGNPNDLATCFDLLLPLALAFGLMERGLMRMLYFACALAMAAGVMVTFSRGGFLGLVGAGCVMLFKSARHNRALVGCCLVAVFGLFLLAAPSGYGGRISSIFDIGGDPTGSAKARRDLLERASILALHHPVIGVGMGNIHIYSIHEQVAHNSFLEISTELGGLGLIAYLALIFAPLRSLRRNERELLNSRDESQAPARGEKCPHETYYLVVAVQAILVAYVICSFFSSIQYLWYLYFPVAYAISLRRICATQQADRSAASDHAADSAPGGGGVLWKQWQRDAVAKP